MPDEDSDNDTFEIADFIEDRSELFVVLGVFSALAIYISQTPSFESDSIFNFGPFGFVSALVIALLISYLIVAELMTEFKEYTESAGSRRIRDEPQLVIFLLAFVILLMSLMGIILQQQSVIIALLAILPLGFMIYSLALLLSYLDERTPKNNVWRIPIVILLGTLITLVSAVIFNLVYSNYNPSSTTELTYSEPAQIVLSISAQVTAIIMFTGLGIIAISVAYGIVSSSIAIKNRLV